MRGAAEWYERRAAEARELTGKIEGLRWWLKENAGNAPASVLESVRAELDELKAKRERARNVGD